MGIPVRIRLYLDASAAKGTLLRRGAGKIKHLEIRQLWCQHAIERYNIEVIKIMRKLNLADCLTHVIGKVSCHYSLKLLALKLQRSLESNSAMALSFSQSLLYMCSQRYLVCHFVVCF